MQKLFDINGYWNTTFNKVFNEDDAWYGQIILDDSGFFEGIVVDDSEKCLISGKLESDKINICFIDAFDDFLPNIYRCQQIKNGYFGNLTGVDEGLDEHEMGAAFIRISQFETIDSSDNVKPITDFQEEIVNWKELYLAGINEFVYRDFLESLKLKEKAM